jgi:AcrR family transcriptional regulator
MQDLATHAGISVGLLYRHYKTKDELYDFLVDEAILEHEQMITRMENLSPSEAINILADDIVDELSKGYEFSQYMGVMLQKPSNKQKQAYEKLIMAIAKIIEQGQESKVFVNGNPLQLAQFLVSTFQGLSSTQLLLKDQFILPMAAQIISFLKVDNNGER